MRLSTCDVNLQGRLSKSPSASLSQMDVAVLCSSTEAWPPLLPSFSREAVVAMDRFVQGFICKRIEYRCGQLSMTEYEEVFLPRWLSMAEHRTELVEDFFAQHGSRLSEDAFRGLFGAFERMRSAMRDARQECGVAAAADHHDKRISFAQPVAHRLIRRSRDRFSLRSVADVDEVAELSRLSTSPCPTTSPGDPWRDSLQLRASASPVPCEQGLSAAALAGLRDAATGQTIVLPVEESADGDHFTGRASGVYYGDLFRSARSSAAGGAEDARGTSTALPEPAERRCSAASPRASTEPGHHPAAFTPPRLAPVQRAAAWRRWWLGCFYGGLIPAIVVFLLVLRYGTTLAVLRPR